MINVFNLFFNLITWFVFYFVNFYFCNYILFNGWKEKEGVCNLNPVISLLILCFNNNSLTNKIFTSFFSIIISRSIELKNLKIEIEFLKQLVKKLTAKLELTKLLCTWGIKKFWIRERLPFTQVCKTLVLMFWLRRIFGRLPI